MNSIGHLIAKTFKSGQKIKLIYSNGKFRCEEVPVQTEQHKKGDLVLVRFVKAVKGFGVTVQLDEKTFGVIELCELTDDITSNVAIEA